jgi:hypothetical protein
VIGGVAPRRLVTRSVERYAGEKLERDRRLVETALVSLRNGQPMRSEPAPAMAESSSPSRTQQRVRTGMTPAAGTVPRLFTSARVPRMDVDVVDEGTSPDAALPTPPPPLGGAFDELLIVQARRRTRITRAVCTVGLLAAAGVAGWLWYDGRQTPRQDSSRVPSAGAVQPQSVPAVIETPAPATAPEGSLARDLERVVQPPSERPAEPSIIVPAPPLPAGTHGRARERSWQRTEAPAASEPATIPATTTPAPQPTGTQKEEGMLPNPYRHD